VHGRDEPLSRLPSAAEPVQLNETIHQIDVLDFTTCNDEPLLHADINTEWDDNHAAMELDSPRFDVGLSPHEWIDDSDLNTYTDLLNHLQPVELPTPMSTYINENNATTPTTTPTYALSALDDQINELGITKTEFYDRLRSQNTINTANRIRAHFDGGSMATTTDQLHCLWFYKELRPTDQFRTLQVADNHRHCPTGIGFLCFPTASDDKCFIRCLYTPSLPATIVSPHDAGIQYKCTGYSCASNFDGSDCSL
jgi:hypothetical protein